MMHIYFWILYIAAFFGHKKARQLVAGQRWMHPKKRDAEGQALLAKAEQMKGAVWFHAASVGEFEQARPIIERLRREQPTQKIVVTFFSPSGYEMRKHYEQADLIVYLPFATRRNAKRFLELIQPSMAVLVKYEFWPAYLRALKKRGVPTYSICSVFRPKQRFFRWWGAGQRRLLRCFTHIYVQDEASRQLLTEHGIEACSVAGDTRFDRVLVNREQALTAREGINPKMIPVERFVDGCSRVIVAGSTWPKDEALLAQYMATLPPMTKLILVPHEIDEAHLHYLFQLFKGRCVRYTRATPLNVQHTQVLIVDTMGLLSSIYAYGQVAYIGGGFGVGIHNTIEAAVFGVPVLFGPNYLHFREAKGLIEAGAARSVKNFDELEAALNTALEQHEAIGAKAAEYVNAEAGASEKIYTQLFK